MEFELLGRIFLIFPVFLNTQTAFEKPVKPPPTIQNGDFEEGKLGEMPAGWTMPKGSLEAGFHSELCETGAFSGKRCAILYREEGTGALGNLRQTIDATPYRGKRIRLKGQLRLERKDGSPKTQIWLRVNRSGNQTGFYDDMGNRPVLGNAWTSVEIVGDVASDAEILNLGVLLKDGNGKAWADDLKLEVLGPSPKPRIESARALTDTGQKNVVAFAKALNYIRYFHPSDEAAKADWERLAPEGIRSIEGAAGPKDLAKRLQTFFAPYAPSASFLAPGQRPQPIEAPEGATLIVRWFHKGVSKPSLVESVYFSKRKYESISARPKDWADPLMPASLDLGLGVKLSLPLVCFAGPDKTSLPRVPIRNEPPTAGSLSEPTAGYTIGGEDRSTRLGDVALAWGTLQHFYPCFDVEKFDWNKELPKGLLAAAIDKDAVAFLGTLRRLMAALKDGHALVSGDMDPNLAIPDLSLVLLDHRLFVKAAGKSAEAVPLGSEILAVDGETTANRLARLHPEISAATQIWMNHLLAWRFLLGPQKTSAIVQFRTIQGVLGTAELSRIKEPWEFPKATSLPKKVTELRPAIWYIDLGRATEDDFKKILPALVEAKGVIFDLRGYPKTGMSCLQHLSEHPLELASTNIPLVTLPDRQGWDWLTGKWKLQPLLPRIKGKIAFLTGGGAISQAETFLGIIEANKLGEIVGEPSAGTNGNVNPMELPGGYQISWTGMKVLKLDGSPVHGVGFLPTVPMKPTPQGLSEGRDEVLEKGLEVVSQ